MIKIFDNKIHFSAFASSFNDSRYHHLGLILCKSKRVHRSVFKMCEYNVKIPKEKMKPKEIEIASEKADTTLSIQKLLTPIFMLDTDCCDEIFEFLGLKDLHSLGMTCRAMLKITGKYFQRNWQSALNYARKDNIYSDSSDEIPGFIQFIEKLRFDFGIHPGKFDSLKEVSFWCVDIKENSFPVEMLSRFESMEFTSVKLSVDFYEDFLKFCINVKSIHIWYSGNGTFLSPNGNPWLLQRYPLLQEIHLAADCDPWKIMELPSFLKKNSTIETFSVCPKLLFENELELLTSEVRLTTLVIYDNHYDKTNIQKLCETLKKIL